MHETQEFWRRLFPTQRSMPTVMWHDNNCRVSAMLASEQDTWFEGVALPVDVFHFKCKHKITDEFCNENCSPYRWPELHTADKQWVFNSSAAEQTNVWFGGFHAIVREMRVDRYNFFLDEMIKRRNRLTVQRLRIKGAAPHNIPRCILLDE
jgi:hypothetical protein